MYCQDIRHCVILSDISLCMRATKCSWNCEQKERTKKKKYRFIMDYYYVVTIQHVFLPNRPMSTLSYLNSKYHFSINAHVKQISIYIFVHTSPSTSRSFDRIHQCLLIAFKSCVFVNKCIFSVCLLSSVLLLVQLIVSFVYNLTERRSFICYKFFDWP